MNIFPSIRKPRQKINLLIAALFVAVQLPLVMLGMSPVNANDDQSAGNNGSVKIVDELNRDEIPNNDPTLEDCDVFIEYYGFDEGERTSTIKFEAQAPTENDQLLSPTQPIEFTFEGRGEEGSTLDDTTGALTLIFKGEPHENKGYKVKVTVETDGSQGNDTKSKVFWVGSNCTSQPEPPTALAEILACTPNSGLTDNVKVTVTNTDDSTNRAVIYTVVLAGQNKVTSSIADGASGSVEFSGLATGNYSASVTGNDGTTTSSNQVTVNNCPVVVSETGSITIVKDADSDNLQEFIFSATGLSEVSSFSLTDKEGTAVTGQNKVKYDNLTAKEYTFTEHAKTGWTLETVNCTKVKAATVITVAIPKVTINLTEGDDVTCTFVNTKNAVNGVVLGDSDEVVTTGGQGGGAVLGAQTEAPVGGVSAGYGAGGSIASSLVGLGTSLSALGYGVASLRKRQ